MASPTWSWSGPVQLGASGQQIIQGTGDPEGIVTAVVGSIYQRVDGGVNSSVYFKETGSSNTGWVAAGTGGGGGTGPTGPTGSAFLGNHSLQSTPYTVQPTDLGMLLDIETSSMVVNVPTATNDFFFYILNDTSSNATINTTDPNGFIPSDAFSFTLMPNQQVLLLSASNDPFWGSGWWVFYYSPASALTSLPIEVQNATNVTSTYTMSPSTDYRRFLYNNVYNVLNLPTAAAALAAQPDWCVYVSATPGHTVDIVSQGGDGIFGFQGETGNTGGSTYPLCGTAKICVAKNGGSQNGWVVESVSQSPTQITGDHAGHNILELYKFGVTTPGGVIHVDSNGNLVLNLATTQSVSSYNFLSPSMAQTGLFLDVPSLSPDGFYLEDDSENINILGSHTNGGLIMEATNTGDAIQLEADAGVYVLPGTSLYAPVQINTQTASYQAVATDADQLVPMNSASAVNFTVPAHSGVGINEAFPIGTTLSVLQQGAGQVTLVPAGGVTINTPSSLTTRAQWSTISVVQIATNVWVAGGDLT